MGRSGDGVPRGWRSGRSTSCSRKIDWIAEEHDELQRAYKHFKAEEQKRTAERLPHKTGNSFKRRHTWSQEENDILIQMVNLYCPKNWSTVARAVPGRSRYQCRDRWTFYLNPAVNNQAWSEQEEIKLIHAHQIHGNKWSEMAKLFPGRTGKAIKNYWVGPMKKKLKSYLTRGLLEQFPYMPNDPLIGKNRGSSTGNMQVSPDLPVIPKLEQELTEACRNASTLKEKGSVNGSQKVDGQIAKSNFPVVTRENLVLSPSSVDQKVSFSAANFPRSLQKEESTNFLEVSLKSVNTGFFPAGATSGKYSRSSGHVILRKLDDHST
ncbi:transcription factor MYB3R-4-like isoform X2 [Phragmites australis]|uniref:transcription factor MYB3R-4-like isoform X2 n=1 Tax=Phragmites australis TaxID=29695 RepID=UPI002D785577|nr:transcription factor MYB3R-4-like isoform X2 [Phragmites australis]